MQQLSHFSDTSLLQYIVIESEGVILYSEDTEVLDYQVICRRAEAPELYEAIKKSLMLEHQTPGRATAL